jgi:hypothetical protein
MAETAPTSTPASTAPNPPWAVHKLDQISRYEPQAPRRKIESVMQEGINQGLGGRGFLLSYGLTIEGDTDIPKHCTKRHSIKHFA